MEPFGLTILILGLTQVSNVAAGTSNADIVGMAVAGSLGFILLSVVITIIVIAFQWKDWFNNWMRLRGKVRMPKAYFKKKEEAKKRLISGSVASRFSEINGRPPSQNIYDTATLVDDWRNRGRFQPHRVYEVKDATVELGEEVDDDVSEKRSGDFTIETEVIDTDEVERDGSVKRDHTDKICDNGVSLYTDVQSLGLTEQPEVFPKSEGTVTEPSTENSGEPRVDYTSNDEAKITHFNESFVHM